MHCLSRKTSAKKAASNSRRKEESESRIGTDSNGLINPKEKTKAESFQR